MVVDGKGASLLEAAEAFEVLVLLGGKSITTAKGISDATPSRVI
jgi:hypothetical protein